MARYACPDLPWFVRSSCSWSRTDCQIENSSEWKINWFLMKQKCFLLKLTHKFSSCRSKCILAQSDWRILWPSISLEAISQCLSFFAGRLILTDYYIYLGVFWYTHLSINLSRLARDVLGSYECYSQMKCSSKRSSEKESFFPSLIHKSSSYTSKCSCPIKLQDS